MLDFKIVIVIHSDVPDQLHHRTMDRSKPSEALHIVKMSLFVFIREEAKQRNTSYFIL